MAGGGQQAVEKAAKEVQRLDALLSAQNEEKPGICPESAGQS